MVDDINAWILRELSVYLFRIFLLETCPSTVGVVGIESSNGVACCLTSCGACGGSGCSALEGGGDGCCTSDIIENNDLCSVTGVAPCLIVPQPDSPDGGDGTVEIPGGEKQELPGVSSSVMLLRHHACLDSLSHVHYTLTHLASWDMRF